MSLRPCMNRAILIVHNRLYGSFTMETVLAAAFGRVMDIQIGQSDELTKAAAALFSGVQEEKTASSFYVTTLLSKLKFERNAAALRVCFLTGNFPWFIHVLRYLLRGDKRQLAFFTVQETASELIQQRQDEKSEPGKVRG